MEDPDPLEKLIEGVADGTLDRQRLPRTHRDPSISQLLAELQILAGVTDLHRSDGDDSGPPPAAAGATAESADPGADSRPAAPGGRLDDGAAWGNFELLRKIGEGSFGEVYLARDLWLGHDVALKILRATVTDRAKMLHEARMLVRIRHPHVVTVHGADVHNGRLGFWMDFVDGVTLHEAIARDGRRSAGEAMAWGQELCRALAAVHAAGIVHRDVKAQNVMRQAGDGRLVLMDFGAGEMLDAPRLGEAAGTPLYLAPELLDGAAATRSSDIYALGVLLFYVVSRQFPVRATSWDELLQAHERRARVRLEDVRPDLPAPFVDVVEKALSPNPASRYASAGDMLAALRAGADTGPLHVTPPVPQPTPSRPPAPVLRTATRLGAVAGGLVATAFGLGFVACVSFEQILRIDPDFASGPADYLKVGREALLPFLVVWLLMSAVVAGLGGIRNLLWRRVGQLPRWRTLPTIESLNPALVGATVLAAGVLALAAITMGFSPVFMALDALRTNTYTPAGLAILAPEGANTLHGQLSAVLSFLLAFAVWKWFPALEARDPAPPTLRSFRWATLGVALLVVGLNAIPRRIVWDDFEVVLFEKQRAFVIGSRQNELLLYVPASPERPWRRIEAGAASLERGGGRDKLFAGLVRSS